MVSALLVAGNLFCMACPFMLPRRFGRYVRERFLGGGRQVPRALRNKWLAVALIVVFFYVYEQFSLWASPWLTAWVAIGYFLTAFVVDTWFEGAAFCKYVCPLGQFNFFSSLVSPLEIKVREQDVCAACRTKDCILGEKGRTLTLTRTLTPNPHLHSTALRRSAVQVSPWEGEGNPATGWEGEGNAIGWQPAPRQGEGNAPSWQPASSQGEGNLVGLKGSEGNPVELLSGQWEGKEGTRRVRVVAFPGA